MGWVLMTNVLASEDYDELAKYHNSQHLLKSHP